MDGDMVFETLDSLWFFSNILSNPTQPQPLLNSNLDESPTTRIVSPVEEESRGTEVLVMCGSEPKMEQRGRKKKSNGGRRRKRADKFIHEKEEIEKAKNLMCVISALVKNQLKSCYYYTSNCRVNQVRGDDHDDDLGIDMMKEHLKSWAHAVACTVK